MITKNIPKDWQSLQREVGAVLSQCGFSTEVEKKVKTVRGNVALDVYAEETINGRKYKIACECKYWKSKIPQTVIHGFRTVINDLGLNKGYIISLEGYQAGSFDSADFTNIELLTWDQFQKEFCDSWVEKYLSPELTKRLDLLLDYTEPLVQEWMCEVPDHEIDNIKLLREKYLYFGVLIMSFTTYSTFFRQNGFPKLPISENEEFHKDLKNNLPDTIKDATGYRDFFEIAIEYGTKAIGEFNEIRKRNNV